MASVTPSCSRSKLPRGRHLVGDEVEYDVDDVSVPPSLQSQSQSQSQSQLEVTPITKYVSDPALVLGRHIAVNNSYICYALKLGPIRVLNINTALRSLLRPHSQRVTDMAFFAEDVHLLASVSVDGRVYVWKISERPDKEGKPQISGGVVIAVHITGEEESNHPRVCWHCHKLEILVVAIGKSVLRFDTTKIGRGVKFVAGEPLLCPLDRLINGIQLVGKHDGEVTDISMSQWMTTRLVSASKDGTIKIWEDRKAVSLLELRPHDGQPVDAVKFLVAPHRPDHIMLITAGPLNREVKLWTSSEEEGWLLPSDAESWQCTQKLELKSSSQPQNEEAFFNQVVTLSRAGLLLLANAKKNAIYAIHLEYGANPAATRMDYLAEFTVTMPILSFTGISHGIPQGEHLARLYCVQTQAIQQYALDLSLCLPPSLENLSLEKSESSVSHAATESSSRSRTQMKAAIVLESTTANMLFHATSPVSGSSQANVASISSTSCPTSATLSGKTTDCDTETVDYSADRKMDSVQVSSANLPMNHDNLTPQRNASDVANPPVVFKHPTHLITPSDITTPSASHTAEKGEGEVKVSDNVVNNDTANVKVEAEAVGEKGNANCNESTCQEVPHMVRERKEKIFFSQASGLGADMNRECCALASEASFIEEVRSGIMEAVAQPLNSGGQEEGKANNDMSGEVTGSAVSASVPQSPAPAAKGKRQKGKNFQAFGSSFSSRNVSHSADSSQGSITATSMPLPEDASPKIQKTLKQLLACQKEMQKQITMMVSVPITKEGRRLEATIGQHVEKAMKANMDALWAHIQEEQGEKEKLLRDCSQQLMDLINNLVNKDLFPTLEKIIKKELAASAYVTRTITQAIENTIASSISDFFQRGAGDKAASQLEKSITSKLEATVARQIQAQFQTSGKQALQDGLKASLEACIIPAFEVPCKAVFEQVDSAFQKGMADQRTAAQHRVESMYSQLALPLRDALDSASSITQTLGNQLTDGQRKLLALATSGPNTETVNPLASPLSNGPLAGSHEKMEQQFDLTKELSRLISEHKYDQAFTEALQRSDVSTVSWLCSQVDLQQILVTTPMPLNQGVLLSLLQQLACDIDKDTSRKLAWMTDVAACIIPHDPMIALHIRPILEQVNQILNQQRGLPTTTATELSSIRVVMHIINSMLISCT